MAIKGQKRHCKNSYISYQHINATVAALQGCTQRKDLHKGATIHFDVVQKGLLSKSPYVGSALVDMLAKCGAFKKAQQVLDELPFRDVVSWSVFIAGCSQHTCGEDALKFFGQMQLEGISPNAVTYTCILNSCGSMGEVDKCKDIHNEIVRQGLLEKNIVLGNALVDMYVKCHELAKAQLVLDELPARDVVSWSAVIAGYAEWGHKAEALGCLKRMVCEGVVPNAVTMGCILKVCDSADEVGRIHDEVLQQGMLENNIALGNTVVHMYARCGAIAKARQVHDSFPVRDVVSWNVLIVHYAEHGHGEEAWRCFEQMQNEGLHPDASTFKSILKACGSTLAVNMGENVHNMITKMQLVATDGTLGTALVDMYVKCGFFSKAQQVILDEFLVGDVTCWNALITGYAQLGQTEEGLACFTEMQHQGCSPNAATYASMLKACANSGLIERGEEVHAKIFKRGLLGKDIVLGTALLDMYAKCGALTKSQLVFDELLSRNVVSWSALISGYAQHGHAMVAFSCLSRMEVEGIFPTAVTFGCVLSLCSHSGLVTEGEMHFMNMSGDSNLKLNLEHYTCMVDLFGRSGHFDCALTLIKKMPCSDCLPVWIALLSACRKWKNERLGRLAFEHAIQLDNKYDAAYICMSYIYMAAGMHDEAERVEAMRKRLK